MCGVWLGFLVCSAVAFCFVGDLVLMFVLLVDCCLFVVCGLLADLLLLLVCFGGFADAIGFVRFLLWLLLLLFGCLVWCLAALLYVVNSVVLIIFFCWVFGCFLVMIVA